MLLWQVLEELSAEPSSETREEARGNENAPLLHHGERLLGDLSFGCNYERSSTHGNDEERLVAPESASSVGQVTPIAKRIAPLSRHAKATNSQCLYRAAVAAREIQVAGHGRLSAPALLANCLLSMISLSDDEDDKCAAKFNDKPSSGKKEGRKILLKSFSQLCAEERDGKNVHCRSSHTHIQQKLNVTSCCLFSCNRRSASSKKIASTLDLWNNPDELSSSHDTDTGFRSCANAEKRSVLRSFVKMVLCRGRSEADVESSSRDHELVFHERWASDICVTTQRNANQELSDMIMENHVSSLYGYEFMYENGYGELLPAGDRYQEFTYELDGAVPQEVVHEVMSSSHDEPISSSFVFEQPYFSPCSSASSTTHSMKIKSAHPWLVSGVDQDFCTTSPQNNRPTNRLLDRVVQDDIQIRLANKRLNLSR